MSPRFEQELEFARDLASSAGQMIARSIGRLEQPAVDFKGRRDLVTEVDREIETTLASALSEQYPSDAILAEEAIRRPGRSGRVWILDPLDGTTNFVHGHPFVAVSIALAVGWEGLPGLSSVSGDPRASGFFRPRTAARLVLGVVEAPVLGESYWALRGMGAWLNGKRIRVSQEHRLERSLLATGFAYRRNELQINNLENFSRMSLVAQGLRRGGSAALDLCYVAAGRFDGFWELYLKPWDVCAGVVLVEEAGGMVTDFEGGRRAMEGVDIVATNGRIHEQLRRHLVGPDPAWAEVEREKIGLIG